MSSTQLKKIQDLLLQYRDCFVMEGDQLGLCNHVVQVVNPKLHDLMHVSSKVIVSVPFQLWTGWMLSASSQILGVRWTNPRWRRARSGCLKHTNTGGRRGIKVTIISVSLCESTGCVCRNSSLLGNTNVTVLSADRVVSASMANLQWLVARMEDELDIIGTGHRVPGLGCCSLTV